MALEQGPAAGLARAQVVLDVAHAVDVDQILDPALALLGANLAVEGHLTVVHRDADVAHVDATVTLEPLHDHRPEHPVRRTAAAGRLRVADWVGLARQAL